MKLFVNAESIIKKLDKYDVVSFDVFDTLICRTCGAPSAVFTLAAKAIKEKYNISLSIDKIVKARISAELTARKKSNKEDVTLNNIYDCFSLDGFSYTEALKQEEINAELSVCIVNKLIKMIYDWCVDHSKIIIITSDMYLPKDVIINILENNGYNQNNEVFVSSELGITKRTGNLYKAITKKYRGKHIIHIGDAIRSDYIQAKIHGLDAYLIKKKNNDKKIKVDYSLKDVSKIQFIEYYNFGYKIFGPVITDFCRWLYTELQKEEKVFFLARDGYLVKRVFESLYPDSIKKNEYLYVSRKAIRLASLYGKKDVNELVSLFPRNTLMTINELYKKIGISSYLHKQLMKKYNIDEEKPFLPNEMLHNTKLNMFCLVLLDEIQADCKEEFNMVSEYLKSKRFEEKVAVVDIGWAGTIQNMLTNITRVSITGYYFGTDCKQQSLNKKSFVDPSFEIQNFVAALLEYPFLAPEGSVERYIKTESGGIRPSLSNFEYDDYEKNIIMYMQNGIIDYAINCGMKTNHEVNGLKNVIRACRKPSEYEVKILGGLTYYENGIHYLAKPESIWKYVINPKKFIKDLSESGWKIGFLKKLFKLNLDYYRILSIIKKHMEKV